MSHLPLDARAILEYLNELGYRNITAVQLKEFMKGMQPHSEVPSTTTKKPIATRSFITQNTKSTSSNHINLKSPDQCKLVKGKEPLVNFHFYLDIKDHQIGKKIEERITELGGNLEFFLTKRVTHFITDRSIAAISPSTSDKSKPNGYRVYCPKTEGGGGGGGVSGGGAGGGGLHINLNSITPSPYYTQSPQTPATPQTPLTNHTHSGDSATDGHTTNNPLLGGAKGVATTPNRKKKTSRADAMLHRALQSKQQPHQSSAGRVVQPAAEDDKRPNLHPELYAVWHLDYAIRFLKKVTADLKQYLKKSHNNTSKGGCEPIILKGHFIKIESIKRSARPYYSVFRKIEWPKVHFNEDGGAFGLTPKGVVHKKTAKDKPSKTNAMTRKSRSSSKHNHNHMRLKAKQQSLKQTEKPATIDDSSEKQCGVCEICKIEYDTLTIHLKTKDHEFFARNQNNYLALDTLIKSSANVNNFLDESTKNVSKQEPPVDSMDADEEVTRQTRQSSRIQTPPPPLKIKTKLKEIDTADKKPTQNNVRKPAKSIVSLDSPPIRHPLPTSTIYKVVEDNKPAAPQTPSIIVKFRKIRQTELSILNGEAENFMFPKRPASSEYQTDSDRQTSTDSNRISSSSISSESHSLDDQEKAERVDRIGQVDATASKRRKTITAVRKSTVGETTSPTQQNFQTTPIQPNRTSKLTKTVCETDSRQNSVTPKPKARRRRVGFGRRQTVGNGRQPKGRRRHQRCRSEDRMGENVTDDNDEDDNNDDDDDDYIINKSNTMRNNKRKKTDKRIEIPKKVVKMKLGPPSVDISQGRVKEQHYSFERIPIKELWYEVFNRQDSCQERMFEYWGSTSYRKLPYEMGPIPIRSLPNCKLCTPVRGAVKTDLKEVGSAVSKSVSKRIKKQETNERSKSNTPSPDVASKNAKIKARIRNKHLSKATFLSYDLMPRKSPREHASTLAILSCLIKQRQDSELDEALPPSPLPKDKTPEKVIGTEPKSRKTPSPAVEANPHVETPEPMQFVSEISENVKRLRRGQRKFEDFIPTKAAICSANKKKPRKPKAGLEFELDEKRLKSLEVKQKSAVELEHEIDVYLGRTAIKSLRLTPPPPPTDTSSGFVDDFSTDIDLIDLIDCYDGGGGGSGGGPGDDRENFPEHSVVHRPASSSIFNLFSAHNRRRKNNKVNRTGWPKKRRNVASRQNLLLRRPDRFRYLCDYQTRQKNRVLDSNDLVAATSMTPPDTDFDDKDDCTRSSVPVAEEPAALSPIPVDCKDESLNNGYMSPSEKADNSDIFTVSSDGLDTDFDVSNSQIKTLDIDDECTTSSTIAVPPATPDPPPPQISQSSPRLSNQKSTPVPNRLMKKEVKVSCKRLRTPFRRFRQRR